MDCKKALTEANGDFEVAVDLLRKKGQKISELRAGKEANEGLVIAKVSDDKKFGMVVTLNCETDFVALTDDFKKFAQSIADLALNEKPSTLENLKNLKMNGSGVSEKITELSGIIGEKIDLSNYAEVTGDKVEAYNHSGNRIAVLVAMNSTDIDDSIGKDIAMQVAAMNPIAIDKDQVDTKTIEREVNIAKEQAIEEGKPDDLAEKIAQGKLKKFYAESTLMNQKFVKDGNQTVREMMDTVDNDLQVTDFKRLAL